MLPAGGERVSVAKLQVALLGSARSLQRELDRLADRADTTTPEGLHFVLQGAALIGRASCIPLRGCGCLVPAHSAKPACREHVCYG